MRIGKRTYDHKGIEYRSIESMCQAYNIKYDTYVYRLAHGYSLEAALTTPVSYINGAARSVTDHLGNTFLSTIDMCEAWNIAPSTYYTRIDKGMTMKEALETRVRKKSTF